MRTLLLVYALLAVVALCDSPTYTADPSQGEHATGYSKPLTFEQKQLENELEANASEYTFDYDASQYRNIFFGYRKNMRLGGTSKRYALGEGEELKDIDLNDFGKPLLPILDQGNCGSCVIFAFTRGWMNEYLIRGLSLSLRSAQHYMTCSSGSQCSGAYGEEIADDAVRLSKSGGLYSEADVPYRARSGMCIKNANLQKDGGGIKSYKTLDGSDRSLLAALNHGHGVMVGVAANGTFQSYRNGVYNGCNSMGINHYVYLRGMKCGDSNKDAAGNCVFDSQGYFKNKQDVIIDVDNSWSERWGNNGTITMKLYGRNGRRCNGIAAFDGDAQILETGLPIIPPSPPGPVEFKLEGATAKLSVVVESKGKVDAYKAALQSALKSLEKRSKK